MKSWLACVTLAVLALGSVHGLVELNEPARVLVVVEVPAQSHLNCLFDGINALLAHRHHVTVVAPPMIARDVAALAGVEFVPLPVPKAMPPIHQVLHAVYTAEQSGDVVSEVNDVPMLLEALIPSLYDNDWSALVELLAVRHFDVVVADMFAWPVRDALVHRTPAGRRAPTLVWSVPTGLGLFGYQAEFALPSGLSSTTQLGDRSLYTRLKELQLISATTLRLAEALAVLNAKRAALSLPPLHQPVDVFHGHVAVVAQTFDFEYARSLPPYVKLIGMMQTPGRPVDDADRQLLARLDDLHARGRSVVYLAFGSLAYLDPPDLQRLVEGVLAAGDAVHLLCVLPRHAADQHRQFLERALDPKLLPRVDFAAWVHQIAVLEHPATRVFVTHGGAQSLVEAFAAAVATLCVPFYGDQPGNCAKIRDRGAGLAIFRQRFTPDEVAYKIALLLADDSYAAAAARLDRYRRFIDPPSQFVRVVEEVAYFGADHLFPASESMSLVERYNVDIIAGLLSAVVFAFILLVALIKKACCH